jgi:hypothetical protein
VCDDLIEYDKRISDLHVVLALQAHNQRFRNLVSIANKMNYPKYTGNLEEKKLASLCFNLNYDKPSKKET